MLYSKRDFLKLSGGTLAAASVTSSCAFQAPKPMPRDWVWLRINSQTPLEDAVKRYQYLADVGIRGAMFEQYDRDHFAAAQACGLQTWRWKWTMNRGESNLLTTHPDWYMVNRRGESCADKPAYVDYYHFVCPNNSDFVDYLVKDYITEATRPYVDGIHLDYVRYPDVVLPVNLWKNYGIEQFRELPEYDYCYCPRCRAAFAARYGADPLTLPTPELSQSWRRFRYDSISAVVTKIAEALHAMGKPVTAAVFPGPEQALRMVRQDWTRWQCLDGAFPMLYNGFYNEGIPWIADSVRDGLRAFGPNLWAGLFCPDLSTGDALPRAIAAARSAGARGVALFDTPEKLQL